MVKVTLQASSWEAKAWVRVSLPRTIALYIMRFTCTCRMGRGEGKQPSVGVRPLFRPPSTEAHGGVRIHAGWVGRWWAAAAVAVWQGRPAKRSGPPPEGQPTHTGLGQLVELCQAGVQAGAILWLGKALLHVDTGRVHRAALSAAAGAQSRTGQGRRAGAWAVEDGKATRLGASSAAQCPSLSPFVNPQAVQPAPHRVASSCVADAATSSPEGSV